MNRESSTRAYDPDSRFVLPIELGGTGATNPQEASVNLNAAVPSMLDAINGIASLNGSSKVMSHQLPFLPGTEIPSIDGPTTVYTHDYKTFNITNYNTNTQYVLKANHGRVSREVDQIIYAAPAQTGIDVIDVNGKLFGVNVIQTVVNKPSFLSPLNDAVQIPRKPTFFIQSNIIGFQDVIHETTLEIATDVNFTNVIFNRIKSTGNCSQIETTQNLELNAELYARVRFNYDVLGMSEWSNPLHFTVTNIPIPITEDQVIHIPDSIPTSATENGYFGELTFLSRDGEVLLITDSKNFFIGLYRKVNTEWTYITNLYTIVANVTDLYSADSFEISLDNQTILIGDPGRYGVASGVGRVHILKTTVVNDFTTLTLIGSITRPLESGGVNWSFFGQRIFFNQQTTKLFVYSIGVWSGDSHLKDADLCVYNFDGNVFTLDSVIVFTSLAGNVEVHGLSINNAGTRIIYSNSSINFHGQVFLLDFNGTDWVETTPFALDDPVNEVAFGETCFMSRDGNIVSAMSYNNLLGQYNHYIFTYDMGVWSKTQVIALPINEVNICIFSSDNNFMLVGDFGASLPDAVVPWDGAGNARIYQKQNNIWTLINTYVSLNQHTGNLFGKSIVANDDFSEIIISEPRYDWNNEILREGVVRIFR